MLPFKPYAESKFTALGLNPAPGLSAASSPAAQAGACPSAGPTTPQPKPAAGASPGPSTLGEVSDAFGRLSAADKRKFISDIVTGAEIGSKIYADMEFDSALQAMINRRGQK